MDAIRVHGLTKRYGDHVAVDGISFEVHEGEAFGILGPNGAGKTTTLEMIEGLRRPDAGEVEVLGQPVWPDPRSVQGRIGVQLQSTSLFEMLTARELLMLFARFYDRQTAPSAPPVRSPWSASRQGGVLRRRHVGRPAAAAGDRACARSRPGRRVPGRAHHRPRPAGAAQPVGRDPRDQRRGRQDGGADDALPGGGRDCSATGWRSWTRRG